MKNKLILGVLMLTVFITGTALALTPSYTARYFNGPSVSAISSNGATFSLSNSVLNDMSPENKARVYFEYIEKDLVCIAIYPTPEACLPKKTALGNTSVSISGLKPNTTYTVKYKMDNTIRCITTPCPGNEFESLSVEFTTKKEGTVATGSITKNLYLGMKDPQVEVLQKILIEQGYLENGRATGFFGLLTLRAVINYQKMHNVPAIGIVGPLTRATFLPSTGEYFEGTISAYSTQCFVDGICSVTVGGKVVVTTRGWARDPVGTLRGVDSISDIEKKIGSNARVYAAKTSDGNYTLYGNKDFYVQVQ